MNKPTWQEFFQQNGNRKVVVDTGMWQELTFTVEEMYEMFKKRMEEEFYAGQASNIANPDA